VFDFTLSNPSAVDTSYTFTFTNGTAGSADYTTTNVTVTVPAGATTELYRYPTADTIDEWTKLYIALELFRLREQLSTQWPYCSNDHSASATEGDPLYLLYLSNPSAVDTVYLFTNGTAGVLITLQTTVTVPAGATTGTVSVPTTADTIDEVDETLALLWNCFGYGYNYRHNNAPTVATITPASATEGSPVCSITLSNPSAVDTTYTFVFTNGTGSADYTTTNVTVTVPGATTGTVSVPTTADTIDEVDETLALLWNCFGYGTIMT
jgi:hypothetical protein